MKRLLFILILALLVAGCAHYKVAVNPEGLNAQNLGKANQHAATLQKRVDDSALRAWGGKGFEEFCDKIQYEQRLYEQRLMMAQEQDLMKEQNIILKEKAKTP